jgi:hypothetical protein
VLLAEEEGDDIDSKSVFFLLGKTASLNIENRMYVPKMTMIEYIVHLIYFTFLFLVLCK